mgnify:CR=1 FL=1
MDTDKIIEDMIASGKIGVMTECAYGSTIADTEHDNTLTKKNIKTEEAITDETGN